jgi:hypothetical protein
MRVKIGDVIEIKTCEGLAYALFTHKHDDPPRYGSVIRVFDRLCQSRPDDLLRVVNGEVRFSIFFPLQAAINKEVVGVIGHAPVPDKLVSFPIFRTGSRNEQTGKVDCWWLWDGKREWRVGSLTAEQRRLPIRETWNDTMLIQRIEEGWRPETDSRAT